MTIRELQQVIDEYLKDDSHTINDHVMIDIRNETSIKRSSINAYGFDKHSLSLMFVAPSYARIIWPN